MNRPQIGSDILADLAISAGCAEQKLAVFIVKNNGQAIEFGLYDVAKVRVLIFGQEAQQSIPPPVQVFLAESVGQTQHRDLMPHLFEALGDRAADASRWTVGVLQFGMALFQRLKLPIKSVECGIADLRIVKDVISVLVMGNELAQVKNAFAWEFHFRRKVCYANLGRTIDGPRLLEEKKWLHSMTELVTGIGR